MEEIADETTIEIQLNNSLRALQTRARYLKELDDQITAEENKRKEMELNIVAIQDRYQKFKSLIQKYKGKNLEDITEREQLLYLACSIFYDLHLHEAQCFEASSIKSLGDLINYFGDMDSRIESLENELTH